MYGTLNSLFHIIKVLPLLISIGNLALLIIISQVYWNRNREMEIKFNIMVLFFMFFLLQNLLFVAYFIFNFSNNFNTVISPLIFLGFEFTIFSILLKGTWNGARLDLKK